jgi:hypothetical protein
MNYTTVKYRGKGNLFKRTHSSKHVSITGVVTELRQSEVDSLTDKAVYIRGEYNRSKKRYSCVDYDDLSREIFLKADEVVVTAQGIWLGGV